MSSATNAIFELPLNASVWDEVESSDPDATVTQTRAWVDAITQTGPWCDDSRMFESAKGRLVVPIVRRRWTTGAAAIHASPPTSYGFGGIIAEGGVNERDIVAVLDLLRAEPRLRICIRPNPLHAEEWSSAPGWIRIPRHAQVVDLRDGLDAVAAAMHPNVRRALRKAERVGVHVGCDTAGRSLPAFFDLIYESRARWAEESNEPRLLAHLRARRDSLRRWMKIADRLEGNCRVYTCTWNGVVVAGTVVLMGPDAHYTRGAMRKDLAGESRANYALHWRAIVDACEAGCSWYHMGESGTSSSLARFKSQFAAQSHHYAELRHETFPVSAADARARALVKRAVRFREAT